MIRQDRKELDPLLTIRQAADYLGVHHRTVRKWIREGAIPVVILGEQTKRIRQSDLERRVTESVSKAEQLPLFEGDGLIL
jgi:excisionase family DNA binding protein